MVKKENCNKKNWKHKSQKLLERKLHKKYRIFAATDIEQLATFQTIVYDLLQIII